MNSENPSRLDVSLEDKYTILEGPAFMTGIQALVRLPIEQRRRDRAAGHNTAGYISGYQGSPLAAIDGALRRAGKLLQEHDIVFRPGVNEELAATAVWGTQYVNQFPGAKVDGVFGIWYGKGPGVDRSVDALRHANWAGTSPLGGSLALAGDDHGAKSSTVACYSDVLFESVGMPLLYPSNVQEILEYGLHGIALSRFAAVWAGMKLVTDVVESAGTVMLKPGEPRIVVPTDFEMPAGGIHIRPAELFVVPLEERLYHKRLYAALAYIRANGLNRITIDPPEARLGIVSAGKSYQDVRKALQNLGLDEAAAARLGIRVLKLGVVWPVEPDIVRRFARGLQQIVVVEEKRPMIETQLRAILYGSESAPKVIGKVRDGSLYDAQPSWVFPNFGELKPVQVAQVLAGLLAPLEPSFADWRPPALPAQQVPAVPRTPSFCSGCPHNRSTKLPAGSRALAGIGCHGMQIILDPANCKTVAQMGGEGMHWIGQQPFTSERHVFANIGDGTYAHSGSLAIRQAVAAGVPITYKLLVNGFVSMTGGQQIAGGQSLPQIVDALRADGVQRIVVVTDDTAKYQGVRFADGVPVKHRSEMEAVQLELREYPGVSVIVYEQPCATERRRLRKQGKWQDPQKRAFINTAVCEGCGDCGKVSGCLSIEPLETEFGRKRKINQSSCNKDFSCTEGFCPSFVTVHGGSLRKPDRQPGRVLEAFEVPEPALPALSRPFNVLVGGIGGTGVVTIGQVLAMAAYIDQTACLSLDVMGLAQKYGAVFSHLQFAADTSQLTSPRIGFGETDTLIGCDLIVATGDEPVMTLARGRSRAVLCSDLIATAEFARNADWSANAAGLIDRVRSITGDSTTLVDGQRLAVALLGDAIASNMLMVGVSWQLGEIPLSLAAIERAIELNGVSVDMNRKAFHWGRCIAHDAARVESMVSGGQVVQFHRRPAEPSIDDLLARREQFLTTYQNAALARRFRALVDKVRAVDNQPQQKGALTRAVINSAFKLLAVKDEYEVARLYTSEAFRKELQQTFEGDYTLHFHIGGWPFARKDPATGKVIKREVGPWLMKAFGVLAKLRGLRGTVLDPFRGSEERRLERALIERYEADLGRLVASLTAENYDTVVAIAALPMKIRGYGHVKQAAADTAAAERDRLFEQLSAPVRELRRAG
ncbi:MAG TPA: indolepyruvate ferredoxin oxidoreductase family protein [Burkholderiaceae bacterium]|nr:indolepyruvate ferredoxin oxidoreductase family protein [Burkholderiaceae bacterium]